MKAYIITQGLVFLFSIPLIAQNSNCNRSVRFKRYEKELPKEICIPKGYLISGIWETTDVNNDGFSDFIFKWRRPELQDGDTLYMAIYTQNKGGTFSHFKTFNNLFPLNFESYDSDYIPKNEKLKDLHKKYEGRYQFVKLTFKNDTLEITREAGAGLHLIITYRYDKNIKNWRYEKTMSYDYFVYTKEPFYFSDLSKKLGPTIDNFTYFIWDEE